VNNPQQVSNSSATGVQPPWPSPKKAWYAVGVFALVLMLNFLDRGIVSLLIGPLKRDLGLTDTEIGYIIGLAFACFYAILGLPIARLADSKSRRFIIGVGIATWSLMTALCGLAQSFWQLFLARVGVGVGEACNGPATFSMLADLFPREKLPRAIAVLNLGFTSGTGIALIIGAAVIQALSATPVVTLPIIGTLHSWQLTFMIVGVPGLLVSLLLRTVVEPARRGRMSGEIGVAGTPMRAIPIKDVVAFIKHNRKTYGPMFLGLAFQTVLAFGVAAWTPEFFRRTYGWTAPEAGFAQGLIFLVVWPLGLIPGSMFAEWLTKKGYDDANLRVTIICLAVFIPFAALAPLMPTPALSLTMLALQGFVISFSIGPQNAALQVITPGEMRGVITALFLFMFNIIGFGLGPSIVAAFTDKVFHDESMLRYSLSTTVAILGPLALITLWSGLRSYGKSVAQSRAWQ
jgi:MFS family permease